MDDLMEAIGKVKEARAVVKRAAGSADKPMSYRLSHADSMLQETEILLEKLRAVRTQQEGT